MMTRGKEEKGEGRYVVLHNQLFRENDASAYPVISIDLINIEIRLSLSSTDMMLIKEKNRRVKQAFFEVACAHSKLLKIKQTGGRVPFDHHKK